MASAASVRALGCPQCGGALTVREAVSIVRCAYCRAAFLARTPGGLFRALAPPRVSLEYAESKARELLRDERCPRDLSVKAVRLSRELVYAPFWRFRATFVGRVQGQRDIVTRRPVRRFHGNEDGAGAMVIQVEEIRLGTEEVVEEVQEIWKATISASPLEDLGVPRLSSLRQMPGGLGALSAGAGEIADLDLLAGDPPAEGLLVDPIVPIAEARAEAGEIFRRFVAGRAAELRDPERSFERLQDRESLLFYPIYRIRFRYRGRVFQATIDGLEGRVVRAMLPARRTGVEGALPIAAAIGGLVVGSLLRPLVAPPALFPELATHVGAGALVVAAGVTTLAGVVGIRELARHLLQEEDDVVIAS